MVKLSNNYLRLPTFCVKDVLLTLTLVFIAIITQQNNFINAGSTTMFNGLRLPYDSNSNNNNDSYKKSCIIPNESELGECISIGLCQAYLKLRNLQDNLTLQNINFMKRIQCENKSNFNIENNTNNWIPHICCTDNDFYLNPVINFTKPIVKPRILVGNKMLTNISVENNLAKKTVKRLVPKLNDKVIYSIVTTPGIRSSQNNNNNSNNNNVSSVEIEIGSIYEDCGRQITNRIYGGEIAELDEYPWLALIFYNSNEFGCSGSLISHNFVMTAAHCVTGSTVRKKNGLKVIRLGEFNVNSQPDCIEEENYLNCADAAIDVEVDKIFVHPNYKEDLPFKSDDIALIRLKTNVSFTRFIMPICLPNLCNTPLENPFEEGKYFSVSGWGRTDLFNSFFPNIRSPIKLKLQVPYVSKENCSEILKQHGAEISDKQICAGGELSKDTCAGDSGGPLMYYDQKAFRWIAYGIVSYGFSQCGLAGHPAVYTNVTVYIDWIISVMQNTT